VDSLHEKSSTGARSGAPGGRAFDQVGVRARLLRRCGRRTLTYAYAPRPAVNPSALHIAAVRKRLATRLRAIPEHTTKRLRPGWMEMEYAVLRCAQLRAAGYSIYGGAEFTPAMVLHCP
jgi:hypothetical protein